MMYIVSPESREDEILAQFNRPQHYMSNQNFHDNLRYILFEDL